MLKRIWLPFLLAMVLLLPVAAQAGYPPTNETEWNKTVKWRTTTSTTLYSLSYRDGKNSWGPDENPADDAIFTPCGTLPAGKYVNVISSEMAGKREVFYWDGGRRSAWIDDGVYTRDTVTITATDGRKTSIPRNAFGDEAAVRYLLSEFLSEADVQAYIDGMRGNSGGSGSSGNGGTSGNTKTSGGSGSSGGKQNAAEKQETALKAPVITLQMTQTAWEAAGGPAVAEKTDDAEGADNLASAEVQLVQAGLYRCVVALEGTEFTVPTAALSWEKGGMAHALATVYAPRTGTATLWEKPRADKALAKLPAGGVVLVLGESGRYTLVLGEGKVGYVITSALTLCDPAEDGRDTQTITTAEIRLEPRKKERMLKRLPEGTAVTVLRVYEEWAFVEADGLTGWLLQSMLAE